MIPLQNEQRFSGLARSYEQARPSLPAYPARLLARYLDRTPACVVDLGCGTGLSTLIWRDVCPHVVGIEPNDDMLAVALEKTGPGVSFLKGLGHAIPLADGSADIVARSQDFHWMEPTTTLAEVARVLAPGGLFAAIDYDWPPFFSWKAEKLYEAIRQTAKSLNPSPARFDKEKHLDNIRQSAHFTYARELVLSHAEPATAERITRMLLSQSAVHHAAQRHPDRILPLLREFQTLVDGLLGEEPISVKFGYHMRIGVRR